jgi:outer membrane protein TolC
MNLSQTNENTNELSKNTEDLRLKIAQRAYELYEQRGRQDGFALQDWLQAEQELTRAAEDRPAEKFLVNKAI